MYNELLFFDVLLNIYSTSELPRGRNSALWAGCFFAKAAICFYLASSDFTIERVTAIRSVLNPISFVALLGGERILRPRLVESLKDLGAIPNLVSRLGQEENQKL